MKACLMSVFVGLLTFLTGSACGSSVIQVSMPMMIVRAEAIGLARIESVEIIAPEPTNEPEFRSYNRTFGLTVVESWRGKFPTSFKARAYSDQLRNPSARVGQHVLVFIGNSLPHPGGNLPEGFRPVFEGGQGFKLVADLVKSGDKELGKRAAAAIKESVQQYKARKKADRSGHGPYLNDEAAAPFFRLLESDSPELRNWALLNGLDRAQVTPFVGRNLIGALDHSDANVNLISAHHLVVRRYRPASEKLRAYMERLPKEQERFKRMIQSYLQAQAIEELVEAMPPGDSARIAELLTSKHTLSQPAYITLVVNKDGQGMGSLIRNGDQKILKLVNADLQSKDFSKLESLPFQGRLCLYLEEGELKFLVREK